MPLIAYNEKDDPTENGVYACRVQRGNVPGLYDDKFLMWYDGRWGYIGSDQMYRGEVFGWIGPLQRRMSSNVQIERKDLNSKMSFEKH